MNAATAYRNLCSKNMADLTITDDDDDGEVDVSTIDLDIKDVILMKSATREFMLSPLALERATRDDGQKAEQFREFAIEYFNSAPAAAAPPPTTAAPPPAAAATTAAAAPPPVVTKLEAELEKSKATARTLTDPVTKKEALKKNLATKNKLMQAKKDAAIANLRVHILDNYGDAGEMNLAAFLNEVSIDINNDGVNNSNFDDWYSELETEEDF